MQADKPLFGIVEKLLPSDLHQAVWAVCNEKRWYFGNQSNVGDPSLPFWKMDLNGIAPIDRMWELTRANAENAVGHRLRVIRQYANGHTYGQGGRPHMDDNRAGCFTLLYYPMLEWRKEWEGETLFFQPNGDVMTGILPAPNRAALFDARIPHAGRAPSRLFPGLRVTVALKLEAA